MIKSLKIFLMGVGTLLWMTACQDALTEHPDSYYEKKIFHQRGESRDGSHRHL